MNRIELISTAKEMGLSFERPVAQVKSEVLEAAITAALANTESTIVDEINSELPVVINEVDEMPIEAFVNIGVTEVKAAEVVKDKKIHIYDEILAMATSGKSRTAIYNELKEKHTKLNYRYVVQTLLKAKAAGVELNVPRQERVFAPKVDEIEKLEAKLAKLKAAVTVENEVPVETEV